MNFVRINEGEMEWDQRREGAPWIAYSFIPGHRCIGTSVTDPYTHKDDYFLGVVTVS